MQQRYEAAQQFQSAHDLPHAAEQYRIFIADALGELATGRAHAGEYDKAANYFDEALSLVPDFPMLQIEYARAALDSGNLQHAKLLASQLVQKYPQNAKVAAPAHALLGRVLLKMNKDAEAKAAIEQAVALDPTFENGYELAVADLDLGDEKEAAKIFAEMLTSFGDTAEIHMYFGQALGSSDFQADAVEEFKKAIEKDDRLPGVHYSLAAAYLSTAGNAKLPEAESELRKEIANTPHDGAAYAALGHLLAEQHRGAGEVTEAESDLKRATQLDPRSPDAFLYLGQLYAEEKRQAGAETSLRQSIALTGDVSRNGYQVQKAHYLLGRLLMQDGHAEEGQKEIALSRAVLQQNLSRDQNRLTDYLQEDKHPQTSSTGAVQMPMAVEEQQKDASTGSGVDTLERQLGPAIADSYNNLGAASASQGNFRLGTQYFGRAAEWNPSLPGLDLNWGRAAFAAGENVQAIGPLSRYLQAHPDDEGARTVLGLSEFMARDYTGARTTLQLLNGKNAAAAQVQLAYAVSLVETGDVSGGVSRLVALEKSKPESPDVHRALGEAYVLQKNATAAAELETAIRLNPSDAEALGALARLQLARGDRKAALTNLKAALKLQPEDVLLHQEFAEAARSDVQ